MLQCLNIMYVTMYVHNWMDFGMGWGAAINNPISSGCKSDAIFSVLTKLV